jgi:protein arginine kinase activator
MQCECCQEHEATIHLTQVLNGESRELHLCEECAEEHGLNVQGAMSVPELLFGMASGRGAFARRLYIQKREESLRESEL